MAPFGTIATFRVTWDATDETQTKARNMMAFARTYICERIVAVEGVNFVLASLTGITINAKKKTTPAVTTTTSSTTSRAGISFVISYTPNLVCDVPHLRDVIHTSGFSIENDESLVVKEIESRGDRDERGMIVQQVAMAVKDHSSPFVRTLCQETEAHCRTHFGDLLIAFEPIAIYNVNKKLTPLVEGLKLKLSKCNIKISISSQFMTDTREFRRYSAEGLKGVDRAAQVVVRYMKNKRLGLRKGFIYKLNEDSVFTYEKSQGVEEFIVELLGNPEVCGELSLVHRKTLIDVFSHSNCTLYPQLKLHMDIIEVKEGKCWSLPQMKFIPTPLNPTDLGFVTPRRFFPYQPSNPPSPSYFKDIIANSFPQLDVAVNFLNKWYQLALGHRNMMKLRRLMVTGPTNCGKTTLVNPILEIIDEEKVISITLEKNSFNTSMFEKETELCFVDEFVEEHLTPQQAKNLCQGGFMCTSNKHQKGRVHQNRSQFYFTAQNEPNWGEEDANVKLRLSIFEMKKLPNPSLAVDQWLKDHAFECIAWSGLMISRHRNMVKREELHFHYSDIVVSADERRVDDLRTYLERPLAVGVVEDVELFDEYNAPSHNGTTFSFFF